VKRLVKAVLTGQLCHPEWKLRVRDDLGPVVLEGGRRKALAERILIAEAVTAMKVLKRDAFGRVLRMQVEWEPYDVGVELAP
jgi:hypothetical protein